MGTLLPLKLLWLNWELEGEKYLGLMKRIAIAIVVIAIIAATIGAVLFYPHVKIADFTWIGEFNPKADWTFTNEVKVTIKNYGFSEISGITLTVKLISNGTELDDSYPFVTEIDSLHAGESREISGYIYWTGSSIPPTICVSTIEWGGFTLDQWAHAF